MPESNVKIQERAIEVTRRLAAEIPEATCALRHKKPLQLLVATILSAQCTDERVNMVTPGLFKRFPSARSFAESEPRELEEIIHSTGFFRNKAKSIKACCEGLVEQHGGKVPRELDALVKLPGIGRKTANVILGTAYGIASGVVVDTHVQRISRLLGLTSQTDPKKIERDLMELLPRAEWIDFAHRLIWHGRRTCIARRPRCDACCLAEVCPSAFKAQAKPKKKTAKKARKAGGKAKPAHKKSAPDE